VRCLRHGSTSFGQCPCNVSGGKGGHSFSEQQSADALRGQEFGLTRQQLGLQNSVLGGVNSQLQSLIANGGMSPGQQAALTSLATNNLPAQYRGIQGQITNQLTARGISGGQFGSGSGDIARNFGSLFSAQAGQQQQALSNIQLAKQQQLMQALGMQMGVAGGYSGNVNAFNSGTIGALGSGVTAANNADIASTSWMGPVFGALGAVGGGFANRGGGVNLAGSSLNPNPAASWSVFSPGSGII
jgi:hypothetical protein